MLERQESLSKVQSQVKKQRASTEKRLTSKYNKCRLNCFELTKDKDPFPWFMNLYFTIDFIEIFDLKYKYTKITREKKPKEFIIFISKSQ